MKTYNPLHIHSDYSLLDGLSKPKKIARRVKSLGLTACAITDHGNIAAAIEINEEFKAAGIKPIFGVEAYLCQDHSTIKEKTNGHLEHLVILSKNKNGWKDLLKLVTATNEDHRFYRKPRLSRSELTEYVHGNFISFSGHPGSELASILFTDPKAAYRCRTFDQARNALKPTAFEEACQLAREYEKIFGKGNFYIEIQVVDQKNLIIATLIAEILRAVSKETGIPCVATADSHYPEQQDAADQRVLLCSSLGTTLNRVSKSLENDEDVSLGGFFRSNRYHIPSPEEMCELHEGYDEELENSLLISSLCEPYDIITTPALPKFDCPPGFDSRTYLRELCERGWKTKIDPHIDPDKKPDYISRLENELNVIESVNLSAYFLIVADYIADARKNGEWVGVGRGSAGGCLISYLLDIIRVDPVANELYFERFYNAGRNSPGNISFPDIDSDFEIYHRGKRIDYIKNKFGHDKVAQVCSFSRLMGRGALKEVLRAHEACSFDEMNKITEHIPDEAAISDQLQEMTENGIEPSILRWALEHNSKKLAEYCVLEDENTLVGPYANYFAQAMRLEGIKKAASKHPSALIVSSEPLNELVPLVHDKSSDQLIVGFDGSKAEKIVCKFDILGTKILDKMHKVATLVGETQYAS